MLASMELRVFTEAQQGATYDDTRCYLQTLDLADLDDIELVASEVMPAVSG